MLNFDLLQVLVLLGVDKVDVANATSWIGLNGILMWFCDIWIGLWLSPLCMFLFFGLRDLFEEL